MGHALREPDATLSQIVRWLDAIVIEGDHMCPRDATRAAQMLGALPPSIAAQAIIQTAQAPNPFYNGIDPALERLPELHRAQIASWLLLNRGDQDLHLETVFSAMDESAAREVTDQLHRRGDEPLAARLVTVLGGTPHCDGFLRVLRANADRPIYADHLQRTTQSLALNLTHIALDRFIRAEIRPDIVFRGMIEAAHERARSDSPAQWATFCRVLADHGAAVLLRCPAGTLPTQCRTDARHFFRSHTQMLSALARYDQRDLVVMQATPPLVFSAP